MKKRLTRFALAALWLSCTGVVNAQGLPYGALVPQNPTTADNIKLTGVKGFCGPYKTNAYRLNMVENNLIVRLGENPNYIVGVCPPEPIDEYDLGRLPVGNYTLTVIRNPADSPTSYPAINNVPFAVITAPARVQRPTIRLVYDGSWWNPADSGSGLFIWQDQLNRTFAAWFTYSAEGKPQWYVFQPTWPTSSATGTVDLIQTSRMPSASAPPPNPTTNNIVGKASLDFTNFSTVDKGVLTITLTGGAKQVINIQRLTR